MAGAKFSPVLAAVAAVVGALLVALTQARGHCHSGRYYSGLELARDQITPPAAFLPTLGLAECSQQPAVVQVQVQGEAARAPAPGPHLTVSAAGGQWRHVTLSRAPHHSCGCHDVTSHDVPLVGLSLAWCRVLGVFAVLTRELGMGK